MTRRNLLPVGSEPLRHGYRLCDIHRYALMAAASRYAPRTLPHDERVDIAWHAIVECLYEAVDCPPPGHLCHIGAVAVSRATGVENHHAGRNQRTREVGANFVKFWTNLTDNGHEDAVVDRLALQQVLPLVCGEQREALLSLATCGTRAAAAVSLGLTQSGLDSRLRRARMVIYAAWFEGQTPPGRRRDRRVFSYTKESA